MMDKTYWSYSELAELGIEVCASCGGANIEVNQNKHTKDKPSEYCYDCEYAEGSSTCMPDDDVFYPQAKETLNKLKAR